MTADTAPALRFKLTDHAGTTRCFFGQEQPDGVYYIADVILTDANCDGVSEGMLTVTGG